MGLFDRMKDLADRVSDFIDDESDDSMAQQWDKLKKRFDGNTKPGDNHPPLPGREEDLSVNIAINGKCFGPYDRTSLVDMIASGRLTPDTHVFTRGMTSWLPARLVPQVSALFSNQLNESDIPPIPDNDILSPRLNSLIAAAMADGHISDMERRVLMRNAQEEGLDEDEFTMILEARLYQQRNHLATKQKEMINTNAATSGHHYVSEKSIREKTKCPHCGALIKALASSCPDCGYEYRVDDTAYFPSATERLSKILADIDNQSALETLTDALKFTGIQQKKADAILNFPVPGTKKDLFDFFAYCVPNAKKSWVATPVEKAFLKKCKEILIKARVVLADDEKLLNEINTLANKYKIKV